MQTAFGIVLFVVVVIAAIVAVIAAVGSNRAYDQIGRGGLSIGDGSDRPAAEPAAPVSAAVREEEIRQMLRARNERRARRGEAPLDVEAEVAALTRPAIDPALLAEIRSLVEARNERRARRGQPPLDVDAEVERQVRELGQG
ncbi:MAG TPA: hypothetical protein VFT42_01470 [Solirubrobacteraceae bacterium]|nr:hypothetical protein [Solirubrobacteraceae bacterium]